MKIYARIEGGVVFELFETDGDIAEMFHPSFVWVDISSLSPQPLENWLATEGSNGWTFTAPSV